MIKFGNVSKIYPNGTKGLTDVNLQINQGEFVAIIGTSGAGKSTLIRCVNGLNDITSGSLIVNDTEVSKLKGKELRKFRRHVGMIFQSYNLVPRVTVLKNVMFARVPDMSLFKVIFGLFSKEDKLVALDSLNKVGILDKAYIRADQLSGGQQQRVSLARALSQESEILLADEPVSALDPVTDKEVMDDFKRINEEFNKIFKPKKIKLITGEVVEEKVSRTWLTWLIIILLIAFSVILTNFDFSALSRSGLFFQKLASMIPPNWAYFHKVLPPLLDTIKMSFFASLLGAILSVPFAILAANNILKNRFVNGIIRLIFMLARTLPTLVLALIATYIFGLGTFAGVVAIFVFTFSFIGKQLFEVIETVDMGPFEAAEALGVSPLKAFFIAVFPQVLPTYLSTALYAFEGNVRYAAILGYVGAGGIGNILNDRVNFRDFSSVGMILISILATVMIIDSISALIRKKIA